MHTETKIYHSPSIIMSKETNIVEEILIINRLIDSERQRWAQIKADKMALTVSQRDDLVTAYLDSLLDIQSKICCLISQVLAAPLNGNIMQVCPSVYRSAQEQQDSRLEQLGITKEET